MNTVVGDEVVLVVSVAVVVVAVTAVCDRTMLVTGAAAAAATAVTPAGLCKIVVACGTETVRKTAVPPALVVIVAPFRRDLANAVEEGTSVTLMGATFGEPVGIRCWVALVNPLLLAKRLVPA